MSVVDDHLDRLDDARTMCRQVSDYMPTNLSVIAAARIAGKLERAQILIEEAHDELQEAMRR